MHYSIDRLQVVDRLRGLSLLGVVIVNAPFLVSSTGGTDPRALNEPLDLAAAFITWVVFQAKAYVIFSFLFGYSLTLFLASAQRRGLPAGRAFVQRLAALAVIGVVHAVVLFPGDILVLYALLGLPLLLLHRAGDRVLIAAAALLWGLQGALLVGLTIVDLSVLTVTDALRPWDARLAAGTFAETTRAHLALWPLYQGFMVLLQGSLVGAMFCLGLWAGRRRLLENVAGQAGRWTNVRTWGLGIGLPLQLISGWLALRPGAGDAELAGALVLQYLSAPVMSAGIVAAVGLLPVGSWVRLIEPDGRMSLSVYLGESLALTVLAVGWGFGLMGLGAAATLGVAVGTWLVLLAGSHAWLHAGLGQGPAERVLRALTYAGLTARSTSRPQNSSRSGS